MVGIRCRARSGRAGFTLIELMIAVVVLVVAICSAISAQVVAFNLLRTSRETNVAMGDLQGAMELAILQPANALPLAGGEFAQGTAIARFNDLHLRNQRITATYPGYVVGAAVPDPLQIVMTITWDDFQERPRTMRIATIRGR
ncbi:MAG: prepilin-type N-terminal cleavage/methylation domain-containing protein [Planctomycetes bacterium]|jgi:prepilin-type N-terminal cleavage/methylation domain-containing protein|nr:prepilin-type N-terminal cleavage/methylation domain-containing protein [Planctomycetota bacterium]